MNLNKQSEDGIFDILVHHIDTSASVQDLDGLLKVIPLQTVKSFLKSRVLNLRNEINLSSNSSNNVYNNPVCTSQYNEMRQLAICISPITEILPNDIMKHILSFITFKNDYVDKETHRYYRFLPVLSKQFQSIMNDMYFYDANYPLYVSDIGIKKTCRKSKNHDHENNPYDPSAIHIYANHSDNKLEVIHIKTQKFKSTKTIKKISKLSPSNVFKSSLPWKNRQKICIVGVKRINCKPPMPTVNIGYIYTPHSYDMRPNIRTIGSTVSKLNANVNVLNVLNQIPNAKYLEIESSIPSWRIKQYPTFENVIYLHMEPEWIGTPSYASVHNLSWLSREKFPSLKILSMQFEYITPGMAGKLNGLIQSLNLLALELIVAGNKKVSKLKMNANLEFLHIQAKNVGHLDLSDCDNLIGMKLTSNMSFSDIKWNEKHLLSFINVKTNKSKADTKCSEEWFIAYKQKKIPSRILIGGSFVETTDDVLSVTKESREWISEKYLRRRSMEFDEIIKYVCDRNCETQRGWETL